MPWSHDNCPTAMRHLPALLRDKAIEIANALLLDGYDDGRANRIAIAQARRRGAGARHGLEPRQRGLSMKLPFKAIPGSIAALAALSILLVSSCPAEELSGYSGAQLYQRFCASCHGAHGHGDGPVAASIRSMVPDLTQISRRHGGNFPAAQLQRIIDGRTVQPPHGSREMPVWGFEFRSAGATDAPGPQSADDLVGRLVNYLRSIQIK